MEQDFTFEEIEEYLAGNLSQERRLAIEEELRNNPALATALSKHQDAHELAKHYAIERLKNKVKKIQKATQKDTTIVPAVWFSIAASLLLFMLAGGYFLIGARYQSDKLFQESFNTYPNRFTVKGVTEQTQFQDGLESYDKGEYEDAILVFKEIQDSSQYFIPSRLYLSVSYLALGQSKEAIGILEKQIQEVSPYQEADRWYLALAYLQEKEEEKAKLLLQEIITLNGYRSQEAHDLLDKLESSWRKLPGIK